MATIRVPLEAQTLLSLCRKHERGPTEPDVPSCFETYADLLVFAATYGFSEMNGKRPNRKSRFLERPNPIDLGIFKTDRRFPQILLIALATSRDQNVVRDEEAICHLIEDFAAVGCTYIVRTLAVKADAEPHLAIASMLAGSMKEANDVKI
jgi:hypothetical protein